MRASTCLVPVLDFARKSSQEKDLFSGYPHFILPPIEGEVLRRLEPAIGALRTSRRHPVGGLLFKQPSAVNCQLVFLPTVLRLADGSACHAHSMIHVEIYFAPLFKDLFSKSSCYIAICFTFFDGLSFVILLLSFCKRQLKLHSSALEIHHRRHQGEPLLGKFGFEL